MTHNFNSGAISALYVKYILKSSLCLKIIVTLFPKVQILKTIVFPVVMYRCESWTIKKANTEELMLLNCVAGEDTVLTENI